MIKTLLNWSGGIDSTYCLIQWLQQNPKETLLVHHTRINNHQRREQAESKAVSAIRTQLALDGYDNYEYLETGFDYGNLDSRTPIMDHEIIALWSGIILRNPKYWSVREIITPFMRDLDGRTERIKLWKDVYQTIRPLPWQKKPPPPARLVLPIKDFTKQQLLDGLPEQYRKLVWWCRRPKPTNGSYGICGKCPTCKSVLRQYPEASEWHPGNS